MNNPNLIVGNLEPSHKLDMESCNCLRSKKIELDTVIKESKCILVKALRFEEENNHVSIICRFNDE